jgi:hypothetical protein
MFVIRAPALRLLQHRHQWVRGAHLVVAVGPNPQDGGRLRLGQLLLDQPQAGQVCPLQVIQEHHERLLGGGEHPQELADHPVEAVLRLVGGQLLERRLLAHHHFQLRNQVHEHLAIALPRLVHPLAQPSELLIGSRQQLLHQPTDGLRQGGVGNAALELVELAGEEEAAPLHHRLVQLVHHRGLADPGVTADQEQLRLAAPDDPLEALQQGGDLGIASVQPLGKLELVGRACSPSANASSARWLSPSRHRSRSAFSPSALW